MAAPREDAEDRAEDAGDDLLGGDVAQRALGAVDRGQRSYGRGRRR